MSKINRQDPILLKINNNYLIEKNLRILYLISKIFPNENLNYEILGLNISSNESFGFLKENKKTSSNFLQLRTNIYTTTKDFNNIEHNILKELYKKEFLGKITNINNAIDWNYVENYWNSKVDKNAEPNSINKIRPKLIENIKEH